jgi:hypothetical protein
MYIYAAGIFPRLSRRFLGATLRGKAIFSPARSAL